MVRPKVDLEQFLELGAAACCISLNDLRSRKRSELIVTARMTLAWLGVEMYGFTVKEMASGLNKYIETASRWVSKAADLRVEDSRFSDKMNEVDSAILARAEEPL
jgi:hypothetical protein